MDEIVNYMAIPGLIRPKPIEEIKTTFDAITPVVEEVCGYTFDELRKKGRKTGLVVARQVWTYLMTKFTREALKAIGERINQDHTTVIHSEEIVHLSMSNKEDTNKRTVMIREMTTECIWRLSRENITPIVNYRTGNKGFRLWNTERKTRRQIKPAI